MKMRKIIAILIVLLLLTGIMAACTSSNRPPDSNSTSNSESVMETKSPPAKLTVLVSKNELTKDVHEMKWYFDMAAEANVEIEWQQVTKSEWAEIKSTRFASGDIADILFSATDTTDFDIYPGLFADFVPYMEYLPNVQIMFDVAPAGRLQATRRDGTIMALPVAQAADSPDQVYSYGGAFINKKWLDNLNLEMPTTWNELTEVLRAFRDKDPNGNNYATPVVPMDFWYMSGFGMGNFLANTGIQVCSLRWDEVGGWFAEDGKVKNYYIDPRFKDLILWLEQLYSEKLLKTNVFTQSYEEYIALSRGENGYAVVGVMSSYNMRAMTGDDLYDDYVVLPPLKAYDDQDESTVRWGYDVMNIQQNMVSMSAKCKDKVAACRFINLFYDGYWSLMNNTAGTAIPDDEHPGFYKYDPNVDTTVPDFFWINSLYGNVPRFNPTSHLPLEQREFAIWTDPNKPNEVLEEKNVYRPYWNRLQWDKDVFLIEQIRTLMTAEDLNTVSLNQANLSYPYGRWVTEGGIEDEWDDYCKRLLDAGMRENMEIYQKYYEIWLENLDKYR